MAARILGRRLGMRHAVAAAVLLFAVLSLAALAVRVPPGEVPVLRVAGSGFLFNYRIAEATYGFTAVVEKPVANFSVIEAIFEDPAGGPSIRTQTRLWVAQRQYAIRSPNVFGVRAHRPYRIDVRLLEGPERAPIFEKGLRVSSDLDDTILPRVPPVIGPGYMPNPLAPPPERNRRGRRRRPRFSAHAANHSAIDGLANGRRHFAGSFP